MFRTVLWIAAACVAVLLALAVSRSLHFDRPPAVPAAKPAAAAPVAPPPKKVEAKPAPVPPPPPPPPPTPDEEQIQNDAAATGMTTVEPEAAPEEPPH
jgi:hypothetical protein